MATATSLTLRALLSQAAARATLDKLAPVTAGLTPAAKALAAVANARGTPALTLLVVPTDKDVESLVGDARFFTRRSRARPRRMLSGQCCRFPRSRWTRIAG